MSAIPAVILAGGLSRRMGGGNKALQLLAGESLLTHVIRRLQPQAGAVAVNANGDPGPFAEYGLPVIADSIAGFAGPMAGVLAGMGWAARNGAESLVCVSVDTPFLPRDLIARLRAGAGPGGLCLAASPDREGSLRLHPTCALWPVALAGQMQEALAAGQHRIGRFAAGHDPGRAIFDSDPVDPFLNLNTPEDIRQAAALI